MSLIENERLKLSASALNTAATSCFTIGVLAPTPRPFNKVGGGNAPVLVVIGGAVVWRGLAVTIPLLARRR